MRFATEITETDAGRRLDRFLVRMLGGVPPSLVQRLLRQGKVRVNDVRGRPGDRLRPGDEVVVHHRAKTTPRPTEAPPEYDGPDIQPLHQSPGFLVINKPPAMSCSIEAGRPNLAAWLGIYLRDAIAKGQARPQMAHRLDAGTSGAIAVGLTSEALEAFRLGLEEGRVEKRYLAAVWGRPDQDHFEIDLPLRRLHRGPRTRPKVVIARRGEPGTEARTRVRWLAYGPESSLLVAQPITGRTHQIRAHLRAIDLPVVGDPRYGDPRRDKAHGFDDRFGHQWLHAHVLSLDDPKHGFSIIAPVQPNELALLQELGLAHGLGLLTGENP